VTKETQMTKSGITQRCSVAKAGASSLIRHFVIRHFFLIVFQTSPARQRSGSPSRLPCVGQPIKAAPGAQDRVASLAGNVFEQARSSRDFAAFDRSSNGKADCQE